MTGFKPNRQFKRRYNALFKDKNPEGANLFLLLCELADGQGQVVTNDEELSELMAARFEDPEAYQL